MNQSDNSSYRLSRKEHIQHMLEHDMVAIRDFIYENNLKAIPADVLGQQFHRKTGSKYVFSKKNEKDIEEFVQNIPDEKLDTFYPRTEDPSTAPYIILKLAMEIQRCDASFQNHESERKRAEEVALDIKEKIKRIIGMIPQVLDKDAQLVQKILRIVDYPYIRVLGDRMQYLPFDETTNTEDKLRTLYDSKVLKRKVTRHFIKQHLLKQEMSKTYPIDIEQIKYDL